MEVKSRGAHVANNRVEDSAEDRVKVLVKWWTKLKEEK